MTNFEAMDKDKLAEALADSSRSCDYCYYNYYDAATCFENFGNDPCVEGIKKWIEKELE